MHLAQLPYMISVSIKFHCNSRTTLWQVCYTKFPTFLTKTIWQADRHTYGWADFSIPHPFSLSSISICHLHMKTNKLPGLPGKIMRYIVNCNIFFLVLFSFCIVYMQCPLTLKSVDQPFPKQALVFMCLQYKSFENTVGKGDIAQNEQCLLFPQCFLPFWRTFCYSHQF